MELEIYNAFIKAGVPESDAKAAVESINKEIDKRYALHSSQLFTKSDGEALRADLFKALSDQTWRLAGVVFAGMAFMVAALKFVP